MGLLKPKTISVEALRRRRRIGSLAIFVGRTILLTSVQKMDEIHRYFTQKKYPTTYCFDPSISSPTIVNGFHKSYPSTRGMEGTPQFEGSSSIVANFHV
jgi:hypothetical protein